MGLGKCVKCRKRKAHQARTCIIYRSKSIWSVLRSTVPLSSLSSQYQEDGGWPCVWKISESYNDRLSVEGDRVVPARIISMRVPTQDRLLGTTVPHPEVGKLDRRRAQLQNLAANTGVPVEQFSQSPPLDERLYICPLDAPPVDWVRQSTVGALEVIQDLDMVDGEILTGCRVTRLAVGSSAKLFYKQRYEALEENEYINIPRNTFIAQI